MNKDLEAIESKSRKMKKGSRKQGSGCGEIGDTTRKQEKESLGTYFWWAAGGGDSEAEP